MKMDSAENWEVAGVIKLSSRVEFSMIAFCCKLLHCSKVWGFIEIVSASGCDP